MIMSLKDTKVLPLHAVAVTVVVGTGIFLSHHYYGVMMLYYYSNTTSYYVGLLGGIVVTVVVVLIVLHKRNTVRFVVPICICIVCSCKEAFPISS